MIFTDEYDFIVVLLNIIQTIGFNSMIIEIDELVPSNFKCSIFGILSFTNRLLLTLLM